MTPRPPPGRPVSASRWRTAPSAGPRGAADRVRRSHRQTRTTVRLALGFMAAAGVAAAAGTGTWLPLHLFLAGGAVLAMSGVTLMLTVTWSAAPAPSDRAVAVQRTCVGVGAAGVAVGRELDLVPVTVVSGSLHAAGLVLLAGLLVVTARRGVERRFDAAVAAYVAALAAGLGGVVLGVVMAAGAPGARAAHVALNVLGLVGLTVSGTVPFFAATVGRSRMARRATTRRLFGVVAWQATAVTATASGLAAGAAGLAAAGLGAYALGIGATLSLAPRPTRRQLEWAGPRIVAIWGGMLWWAVAVAASAPVAGAAAGLAGRWLLVAVVAGVGQILWGSLAYLLPVLRGGGHELLGAGFAATRSWVGLVSANAAGVALAVSAPRVAAGAVAVWAVDAGIRAARVGFGGPATPRAQELPPRPPGGDSTSGR